MIYSKPSYLKGFEFEVLKEIPATDTYIIEIKNKDFHSVKVITKEELLGIKRIHFDGIDLEKDRLESLKRKKYDGNFNSPLKGINKK